MSKIKFDLTPPGNKTVELYDEEGNLIITTDDELMFHSLRLQIKNHKATGYYFIFDGKKLEVDSTGRIVHWPEGFMDTLNKLLIELL